MKCNAKSKSALVKKSFGKTGGGESEYADGLESIDEDIVEIIGQVPISGQPHTAEPLISFEGYTMNMTSR